jgi:hypothetical protein
VGALGRKSMSGTLLYSRDRLGSATKTYLAIKITAREDYGSWLSVIILAHRPTRGRRPA